MRIFEYEAGGMSMFDFHFLRPWLLIALPLLFILYFRLRRKLQTRDQGQHVIAKHLAQALTPRQSLAEKIKPLDLVMCAACLCAILAAGPAWRKVVENEHAQVPLVLVLKASQTMLANDFSPNRLERAKQKMRDVLDWRAEGRTALIVYASSSHKVLPMTEDNRVFLPFIEAIQPGIMPNNDSLYADDAAQAIRMAAEEVERAGGGVIVLLADAIQEGEVQKLKAQGAPFIWWQFASARGGTIASDDGSLVMSGSGDTGVQFRLNDDALKDLSNVHALGVTVSNQDILKLDTLSRELFRSALKANDDVPYEDMARYGIGPLMLLVLLWFRRGFTSTGKHVKTRPENSKKSSNTAASGQISAVVALCFFGSFISFDADAEVVDWFTSKDQQGAWLFERNRFDEAAARFEDPFWQATALYEAGKYQQAAQLFASIGSVDSLYNRANALLKAHEFRAAIAAYDQVLSLQPEHRDAARNKAIATQIQRVLEESGGGVDAEQSLSLEVDDRTTSQNAEGKSQDYQVTDTLGEDAKAQWMRSVNTDMGDFLAAKFANDVKSSSGETP